MTTLLKNIRVQFISLVKAGANRRGIIAKFAGEPGRSWDVPIAKTDRKKQVVYGIVYAPDEADTQGDYTTADEIEKASHDFMRSLSLHNVDREHSWERAAAWVAESWIIRKGDPMFPRERPGAWAVGIRVDDPDLWADVESGKIAGLSMGGTADKVEKNMADDRVAKFIKKFFKKEEESEMTEEQIMALIMDVLKKLGLVEEEVEEKERGNEEEQGEGKDKEDVGNLSKSDLATVVKAAVKPLSERLKKLEASTGGSAQDGKPVKKSGEDLEKLGAEIAGMMGGGK